jgi:hypothetical protein
LAQCIDLRTGSKGYPSAVVNPLAIPRKQNRQQKDKVKILHSWSTSLPEWIPNYAKSTGEMNDRDRCFLTSDWNAMPKRQNSVMLILR